MHGIGQIIPAEQRRVAGHVAATVSFALPRAAVRRIQAACPDHDVHGVEDIPRCAFLLSSSLRACSKVTDASVNALVLLSKRKADMQRLDLDGCARISDRGVRPGCGLDDSLTHLTSVSRKLSTFVRSRTTSLWPLDSILLAGSLEMQCMPQPQRDCRHSSGRLLPPFCCPRCTCVDSSLRCSGGVSICYHSLACSKSAVCFEKKPWTRATWRCCSRRSGFFVVDKEDDAAWRAQQEAWQ